MYQQLESCVKIEQNVGSKYPVKVGTRQGCSLSPTLFNLYINQLPFYLDNIATHPVNLNNQELSVLLYADDIVLLSDSPLGLQTLMNGLNKYCKKWKLKVNTKKTKQNKSYDLQLLQVLRLQNPLW